MVNFYESVLQHPSYYRQFNCNNNLITVFNCPLEARLMKNRFASLWTEYNFLFYVVDGRKIWHTTEGSYDIQKNSCFFIRKGSFVLEQFFDVGFCVVLFFIPDEFICNTLSPILKPSPDTSRSYRQVIQMEHAENLAGFFLSMSSYFSSAKEPEEALLELKFRELILTIAGNTANRELLHYFCALLHEPRHVSLQRLMSENYCYNLRLEQFARMSNRSLSAFKRDFHRAYGTTPGKWLLERRLAHAKSMLELTNKTISEVAILSGFETLAHFSRSFRQYFGFPPSSVRQSVS